MEGHDGFLSRRAVKLLHVALETDPGLSSFAECPTQHTHDTPCRVSVLFPKEEAEPGHLV